MNPAHHWNRYWHDFAVHPLRMAAVRVAFFGLLAYDLWVMFMEHAPRYGAGGMNATQFAWLDAIAPLPWAGIVSAGWLLGGFLAARAALGVAVRQSAVLLAIIYGGIYIWCQADSYQHHYLIALLLGIAAFLPESVWHGRWTGETVAEGAAGSDARHWAIRMIYVQFALVYFWTGFTKLDPVWLSGDTMRMLTASAENQALMARAAEILGTSREGVYTFAAWSVMLGELIVGFFFLWRKLWPLALITAPWFHVGVEVIGFDIELFSYYMIALDLILLAPQRVYQWVELGGVAVAPRLAALRTRLAGWPARVTQARIVGVVCAAVTFALAFQAPYYGADGAAIAAAVLCVVATLPGRSVVPVGLVHVFSAGALWAAAAFSSAPYDYYRLWGGDLKRRGEIDLAIEMYRRANAVESGPARLRQLGELLEEKGQFDEARGAYEEAVRRDEAALKEVKQAVFKQPANAEVQFDLAERSLSLANNCRTLATAVRRTGDGARADTLMRQAASAVVDARTALNAARAIQPTSDRVSDLLKELQRAEGR